MMSPITESISEPPVTFINTGFLDISITKAEYERTFSDSRKLATITS